MTRDEILKLQAGREMDALIAEHVMGHTVNYNAYLYSLGKTISGISEGFSELAHYSTNIYAAWEVVHKMCQDPPEDCWTGPTMQMNVDASETRGKYEVVFDYLDSLDFNQSSTQAYAETAPLAICRAALLAVMADA